MILSFLLSPRAEEELRELETATAFQKYLKGSGAFCIPRQEKKAANKKKASDEELLEAAKIKKRKAQET